MSWLVMMFLLGIVRICLANFLCLLDMLSFSGKLWGIFRYLGGSKSSTSFLGPNAIFLCGWWSIDGALRGIIYASVAFMDPQCVFSAGLVKKMSLISSSNALSLDIFGTLGGMCGTILVGMFPHW